MALVNVTQPVVINPTLAITRMSNDFLRRVCFVSIGETNLLPQKYKEVYNFDYKTYLTGYTETTNALKAFFAQASDRSCILLELGKQEGKPLEDNYDNNVNYLLTLDWFNLQDFYRWIYFNKWLPLSTETSEIVKAYYNTISKFDEEDYQDFLGINRLLDNLENLKKYLIQLDDAWDRNYYNYLAENQEDFKSFITHNVLKEWLNSLPEGYFYTPAYNIWREENGTKNVDYKDKIDKLKDYLTNTEKPSYIHYLPQQMLKDSRIGSILYSAYEGLQHKTYFFINASQNEDIESNKAVELANNRKCVAVFYDNTKEGYNLASSVAGLFASFKFDISDTNPSSPFNYKVIQGVEFNNLLQGMQYQLIQKSLNFLATLANNNVLLNGRYTDTMSIDYRYQWDLVSFEVENALQTLLLNGVNNPIYIVKYNQSGIDTIRSNIKATLNKMISWGCVTDYSAKINSATGEMEDLGDITAIDFNTYVLNNPKDYENEIYGGISFYLRVGRYIRQVVLSITLG